jgi:hypothetical protein
LHGAKVSHATLVKRGFAVTLLTQLPNTALRKAALLYSLLCFFAAAHAQSVRVPVNVAYTRLFALQTKKSHPFSFIGNTGALAEQKSFGAGLYSERRFLQQALAQYQLALCLPTKLGNFGVRGDYFGQALYNETGAGLAYARKMGEKISVGVQFNYYGVNAGAYGSASGINAEAGALMHLTEDLRIGIQVYNPTGVKLGKNEEERLPAIYSFGFGYDVSEQLFFTGFLEKVEGRPVSVLAGLYYAFDQKMFASLGVNTAPAAYTAGFGVRLKTIQLTALATLHQYLGLTPGLMMCFQKSAKE